MTVSFFRSSIKVKPKPLRQEEKLQQRLQTIKNQ
nr:MAG TPA: hypothetical protein [Caudoviricetes sp.]DAS75122.1 MAG TPA: hypothetical protein [Caudoviricetes sp.]